MNYFNKLFYQTVHALSAKLCKTTHCTNVVCCSLNILPSKVSPSKREWLVWGETCRRATLLSDPMVISVVYIAY